MPPPSLSLSHCVYVLCACLRVCVYVIYFCWQSWSPSCMGVHESAARTVKGFGSKLVSTECSNVLMQISFEPTKLSKVGERGKAQLWVSRRSAQRNWALAPPFGGHSDECRKCSDLRVRQRIRRPCVALHTHAVSVYVRAGTYQCTDCQKKVNTVCRKDARARKKKSLSVAWKIRWKKTKWIRHNTTGDRSAILCSELLAV